MSSRGGRRGGGRGGGPLPRNVQVSKALAKLLRHGAEKEGLQLDLAGFANVAEVLSNRNLKSLKVTFEELKACVEENDKQRFTMVPVSPSTSTTTTTTTTTTDEEEGAETKPQDYLIRANQGHSLKIESEGLLKSITEDNMPAQAIHGTTHAAYVQILASGGLRPMGRNHVHFASGLPAGFKSSGVGSASKHEVVEPSLSQQENAAAPPVISGMRNSSTILIYVDLKKAISEAGIKFWMSDNGVILSEGNEEGMVPVDVFQRVEDRTGQGVLLEHGKVVKEAPAAWAAKGQGKGTRA